MKDGYLKVAAVTPKIRVADVDYNCELICEYMKEASLAGARLVVFPELCITGYTCQDLFWQDTLQKGALDALVKIADYSSNLDGIFFVGLPLAVNGKLYNVAAAVSQGKILGIVPKTYLPNYNEFYEARHFRSGKGVDALIPFPNHFLSQRENALQVGKISQGEKSLQGKKISQGEKSLQGEKISQGESNYLVPVKTNLIFQCETMPDLKIAAEICEDLWVPNPPSIGHALAGANLIVNLSASDELTGKSIYRRELVAGQSARLVAGYIYASAGDGESTQDVVYSGHNIIAENGSILKESKRFDTGISYSEIDLKRLEADRRRMTTFEINGSSAYSSSYGQGAYTCGQDSVSYGKGAYTWVDFSLNFSETSLSRYIDPAPFVPSDKAHREQRCEEILMIQAMGLKKRLEHIGCQSAVIGISGGLDSTLALLVTVKAFDLLGMDHSRILAVTMPGFGTTDRTYDNAVRLIQCLGASFKEVSIVDAVTLHFRDIGQDMENHDVTYENGQARERTQILMDLANKSGGIVIGTGDLSELALGWATYNGDHMSMYAVNASVPKTLVRHLVRFYADTCGQETLAETLYDVLDTPVSPELLPPKEGEISQITEDLVGPYELHDFFLYHMLRCNSRPAKIYRLAKIAFADSYDQDFILKWEKSFYRRFFAQHFKRSCLPDGPKVGSVAVSPRGDLRMPTDASRNLWMKELEKL